MSTRRTMPGGRAEVRELERGPSGRVLCRWCRLEVPAGRRTFCSDFCVEEWRLRSDPGFLREKVFARDRGVCERCGLDCLAEFNRIRRMRGERRREAYEAWGIRPGQRASLWDADHVVPVVLGGGECDLDNLRTLCLKCHREGTAKLRRALEARRQAGLG